MLNKKFFISAGVLLAVLSAILIFHSCSKQAPTSSTPSFQPAELERTKPPSRNLGISKIT